MFERIVEIVLPVTVCSVYTCVLIRILAWNLTPAQPNLLDNTWRRLGIDVGTGGVSSADSTGIGFTNSLIIVMLICSLMILVTLVILLILYMGWHQCLVYYFYLPSLIILAGVTPAFLRSVLQSINLFVPDIYTVLMVSWNFLALGMMAIFSLYAPTALCVQQFYLIHNSAMLSLLIIHALPGWAPWLLLSFLVLWDLFAVLAPFGPLKLIIGMAERLGISEMPGLIYSTQAMTDESARDEITSGRQQVLAAGSKPDNEDPVQSTTSATISPDVQTVESNLRDDEQGGLSHSGQTGGGQPSEGIGERNPDDKVDSDLEQAGLSIGLGDFIFYSLLIGLTSRGRERSDFYTALATLVAVLFGLVLTLILLAVTKRALPALPISVGLGLVVAALTSNLAAPFSNELAAQAIFI